MTFVLQDQICITCGMSKRGVRKGEVSFMMNVEVSGYNLRVLNLSD